MLSGEDPRMWQEALKALELGVVFPGVHQRSSALPMWGRDWYHHGQGEVGKKQSELKALLDQGGDPQGPSSQAQQFWGGAC